MKTVPRLLNHPNPLELPRDLFADLALEQILSAQAIHVLQQPCGRNEMARRNELFILLEQSGNNERISNCLSVLGEAERAFLVWKNAKVPLDRYYRYREMLEAHIRACRYLASLHEIGSLFAEVSAYFSSVEETETIARLREDSSRVLSCLNRMSRGLLSFADKCWLTPDAGAASEFDCIAACAEKLGFSIDEKKRPQTKISLSLSQAVCELYAEAAAEIESVMEKSAEIDFHAPLSYIPEMKFLLEIHDLMQRAAKIGVPYCIPIIAEEPQYRAKSLYDISLLAKGCERIIPNDADYTGEESFYFLLGANSGGKTTYLRAVGVNLVLFLAGCPVFAEEATIYPFDFVACHFPRDERFDDVGRLEEEVHRAEEMLAAAKGRTAFLLFNETFSGTDEARGVALLQDTAAQVREAGYFGVYVTHFHAVMEMDYPILSAEIDPEDENKRTYRIAKAKGKASSYAADILRKYRLDRESLLARRNGNGV